MARRAPLEGIRVADFTWVWAGPFCTLQLAHLGAEVIRVETATRLCVTRLLPPYPDMQAGTNRSGYFNQYNQGKKSITLDLKRPEAVEVARRLCAASDVVAENFAAGVMDRAGLGYVLAGCAAGGGVRHQADVLRRGSTQRQPLRLPSQAWPGPDHARTHAGSFAPTGQPERLSLHRDFFV